MTGNPVSRIGTCRQCFDGKSVAQVVKVWLWATFQAFDTSCIENQPERLCGNIVAKLVAASVRNENVLVIAD